MIKKLQLLILLVLLINTLQSQESYFVDTVFFNNNSKIKSIIQYKVIKNDTLKEADAQYYYVNGRIWQAGK